MIGWFRYKKTVLLLLLLLLVVLAFNHPMLWKFVYPIEYENEVGESSARYHINPYVVLAVIRVESNFFPNQRSSRGAVGLMQIMPNTAEWIVQYKREPKEILSQIDEPHVNIDMGTWFLMALHKEFGDNWVATLAAYNAGPGNVHKWIQNGWEPSMETIDGIPFGETRHYVQRVLYYVKKYEWVYAEDF
jgi:soluble lytic murein transglycosylase